MAVSQSLELNVNGTKVIRKTVTSSDESKLSQSYSVADSQTDEQHAIDLDVSTIKSLYIVSTQVVTLEWNDASGTQGALALLANEPVLWWNTQVTDGGNTLNPVGTADITDFYVTNASGSTAEINVEIVYDASP